MNHYKLTPSDLTFLWEECRRCFVLKVKYGFKRPGAPFPSIFGRIDSLMKAHFQDQPSDKLHDSLPAGQVRFGERWVQSQPIQFPELEDSCYLLGKFDSAIAFADGSFGVVDFKTSQPRPHFIEFYGRQLHAYSHALEHPEPGKFGISPITRLGLFVVEPTAMRANPDGRLAYLGEISWIEVPRDDTRFLSFLESVMLVLGSPQMPAPGEGCAYCKYRQASRDYPGY
jgi:hypothetical protein